MIRPERLQRSRKKGARLLSPNGLPVVCVTRPGRFGNPFTVALPSEVRDAGYWGFLLPQTKEQAVIAFALWLKNHPDGQAMAARAVKELRGKNLACWCRLDEPCHAAVLLEIANAPNIGPEVMGGVRGRAPGTGA